MESRVFADTSWFMALIDDRDEFHDRAVKLLEAIKSEDRNLVTTNYVIDETFTLLRQKCPLDRVKAFFHLMGKMGKKMTIIRVGVMDEKKVWECFWKDWSKLSYTDCTSFAVMKRLGLEEAVTFDQHFARAGFKIRK